MLPGFTRVFLVCFFAATLMLQAAPAKPNVLIIVADDLGFADVGFNGGKTIATPSLDRLAETGVKLADFRSCPMCSPTRAGLVTGRWPIRYGLMRSVVPPWSTNGLPPSENTIAELLAKAGYERRGMIGKWHLGQARKEFLPLAQGFTSFYGHYNGAIDYFDHNREGETDWHRDSTTIKETGYSTDLLGAEAAKFVQDAPPGKPWLLYLAFNAPHAPFQAKQSDLAKYSEIRNPDRRAYAAMVDSMDQAIGKVLSAVDAKQDASNTFILFFSDNGGVGKVGSNGPWRGAKLTVYEGGTRVAAVARWTSGGIKGGKTFDGRIGYIDVLPTVLSAAGAKRPRNLDGIDFLPALSGKTSLPARKWYSYMHQSEVSLASVHEGDWKLVAQGDFFSKNPSVSPVFELYNLRADAQEKQDVSAAHPEIVRELRAALLKFGRMEPPGGVGYDFGKAGFKAPKDWVVD